MGIALAVLLLIRSTALAAESAPDGGTPVHETTVRAVADPQHPEERATSEVRRSEMDERLPRSAPDALRFEPGVFVQQTAHAQGSAYVRGLTGQQTVLLFDGIRLNNSTYRQGPNQYFFTLDSRTISSIEVLRGGASTLHGSDALGGVIAARPLESSDADGPRPSLFLRGATADLERGGRVQVEGAAVDGRVRLLGGIGARRIGLLTSAGPVKSPETSAPAEVPRFGRDGRTQLGTGFDEVTADGRLILQLATAQKLTLAAYTYRQSNAPRTDQCPPATARFDECLVYDEQWRSLVYAAWDGRAGPAAEQARATLSWQRQHERRTNSRPASFVQSVGRDDVDTLGVAVKATTARWTPTQGVSLRLDYGADTYLDFVASKAWLTFTDIAITTERSRGQYVSGSRYLYGGAYLRSTVKLPREVTLRAGGRAGWVTAHAPADPESGSTLIDRAWLPLAAMAGAEWSAMPVLSLVANVDHSFRTPNLDDLTSRQQTGPGFQFENAKLAPERATTLDVGVRLRSRPVTLDVWAFRTLLTGAVAKLPREADACPPQTPQCGASRVRFQLVNLPGTSTIHGLEAALRARLPLSFTARATFAWTLGEGPSVSAALDPEAGSSARDPLSRVPPLNGTAELRWTHPVGIAAGAALRWAGEQRRLAVSDRSDPRIPQGGTPGFAVADLRLSYRLRRAAMFAVVVENLLDIPYRYHGSSVNGAGRGVILTLELTPFERDSALEESQ